MSIVEFLEGFRAADTSLQGLLGEQARGLACCPSLLGAAPPQANVQLLLIDPPTWHCQAGAPTSLEIPSPESVLESSWLEDSQSGFFDEGDHDGGGVSLPHALLKRGGSLAGGTPYPPPPAPISFHLEQEGSPSAPGGAADVSPESTPQQASERESGGELGGELGGVELGSEVWGEEGCAPGPYTWAALPVPPPVPFTVPYTVVDMPMPEVKLSEALEVAGSCRVRKCRGWLCQNHGAGAEGGGGDAGASMAILQKNAGALETLVQLLGPETGANLHLQAAVLKGIQTVQRRLRAFSAAVKPAKQVGAPNLGEQNAALRAELRATQEQLQQRNALLEDINGGVRKMQQGCEALYAVANVGERKRRRVSRSPSGLDKVLVEEVQ